MGFDHLFTYLLLLGEKKVQNDFFSPFVSVD